MDMGLRGRGAFVAAASKGIGHAIADELCREGAGVGICARDQAGLDAAATALREHGTKVVATRADVTNVAEITNAIDVSADALGRLDCLIVNGGGPAPGTFETVDDAAWQNAFELNVMSVVHLIRHALPLLRRSDAASIVIVSSTSVVQPIGGLLLSTSLRRAVTGMVESLAVELAPHVRINSILPRATRTDRIVQLVGSRLEPGQTLDDALAADARSIPLRRYSEPAECARAAVFLASTAASYITGVELPVDGGKLRTPL